MNQYKSIFENIYSSAKNIFQENKSFLYTISIVMAVLATAVLAISMFDLQNQGANFFESLDPEKTKFNYSPHIILINVIFNIASYFVYFSLFIFFYHKLIKTGKTFSDSFTLFLNRVVFLFITTIIYTLLIIPLFILLIVPGVIFCILWMFYTHAVLLRNKNFYSALKYSQSLVRGKKMETVNNFLNFGFRQFMYWLPPLILMIVAPFMKNSIIYISATLIATIFFNVFYFYGIIFSVSYFLDLEKRVANNNEVPKNEPSVNQSIS